MNGARSSRSRGCRVSTSSLVACCIQKPAAETVNSRRGERSGTVGEREKRNPAKIDAFD